MATIMTKRANTKRPMIMIRRNGAGGPAAPLRSRQAAPPGSQFNQYGSFAADLLQVQPSVTIDTILNCRLRDTGGAISDDPGRA